MIFFFLWGHLGHLDGGAGEYLYSDVGVCVAPWLYLAPGTPLDGRRGRSSHCSNQDANDPRGMAESSVALTLQQYRSPHPRTDPEATTSLHEGEDERVNDEEECLKNECELYETS